MTKPKAARASGTMTGARRVVTMLFCDVKGFTAAAEQLDPEEWIEIINGAFEHMIKPVYKVDGTVARLVGDAINLASHMEQTAEPGIVQIAHDTYK